MVKKQYLDLVLVLIPISRGRKNPRSVWLTTVRDPALLFSLYPDVSFFLFLSLSIESRLKDKRKEHKEGKKERKKERKNEKKNRKKEKKKKERKNERKKASKK